MLSSEVQGKVVEAFEVFDHENNKTVDVREVNLVFHKRPNSEECIKEIYQRWAPLSGLSVTAPAKVSCKK